MSGSFQSLKKPAVIFIVSIKIFTLPKMGNLIKNLKIKQGDSYFFRFFGNFDKKTKRRKCNESDHRTPQPINSKYDQCSGPQPFL